VCIRDAQASWGSLAFPSLAGKLKMPYPKQKVPEGGVKATFPGFVAPALASSIGKVPSGDRWIHEVSAHA
jgi:hypothetical protein